MGHGRVCRVVGDWALVLGPCVSLVAGACNDRADADSSPSQITERMMDTCLIHEGQARCWALSQPVTDEEVTAMLLLRDTLEVQGPLPSLDLGRDAEVLLLATGAFARCAVLKERGVKCWGDNGGLHPNSEFRHYALGLPDISVRWGDDADERGDKLPLVDIGSMGSIVGIGARAQAGFFVLDEEGRVKGWGASAEYLGLGDAEIRGDDPGELGDNLPFVDLGTDFVAIGIAVGSAHACVWTEAGALKCWGNNEYGQLGTQRAGTIGDEPGEMGDDLQVVDLGPDAHVRQVVAGSVHTCALLGDGSVTCWGGATPPRGSALEPEPQPPSRAVLGLEKDEPRIAPLGEDLPRVDLGADVHAVAIDGDRIGTCALLDTGGLKCWGPNSFGQLGQEHDEFLGDAPGQMGDSLPEIDLGRDRTVTAFSMHDGTACALLDDDSVKCWGRETGAGEEPGTMGDNLVPVATAQDLGLAL